jgi:4-aminobutyrate aminotransferase-like enzyme/Ser/Thr protein kinase RdoA (MazF antagonist)
MEPDSLQPVPLSDAAARQIAARLFGHDAPAVPLPGEYDNNFHVAVAGEAGIVLKVMHPSREPALIDLQARALQHLAVRAPALPLQRLVPSGAGDAVAAVEALPGTRQHAWAVSYLAGRPLAATRPREAALLRELGQHLGAMTAALADFDHPAADRDLKWDLARADWIGAHLDALPDPAHRALVAATVAEFARDVRPALPALRRSIIHGDVNDYNVLTIAAPAEDPHIAGIIDFGDMHRGLTVAEPAVAIAYAIQGQDDVLAAASAVVAGFHERFALTTTELALLGVLVRMRLCVSVVNSALRQALRPDDPYVTISERPAWEALERLAAIPPRLLHYALRDACGLAPVPQAAGVIAWLRAQHGSLAPVLALAGAPLVLDLSVGSPWTGADPSALAEPVLTARILAARLEAGAALAIGRYAEVRALYSGAAFGDAAVPTAERRCLHLGLDLFAPAGTAVHAPLAGVVVASADRAQPQDYGPVIVLRHRSADGTEFCTLYGHLSRASLAGATPGRQVAQGEAFAAIGAADCNGGWTPHLHLQLLIDELGLGTGFPGVARSRERDLWCALSPDPNLLTGFPADCFPAPEPAYAETLAARRARLGANLSLSYRRPVKAVRGWRQFLYDADGRAYLDAYNNVPVCGHSHPRVVAAVQRQVALLNTNTRYLHDTVLRYAERLTALLPAPLSVCFFVNSATEANELALRLVRTHTGREDMIVLEHAYHGHSSSLVDLSPYKFAGPGGSGRKAWVHVAPLADDYRGAYRRGDPQAGAKYAARVAQLIAAGVRPAGFIAESLPSVGGQVVFPPGYLAGVYSAVRSAGGLCIADEVQTGFGRIGHPFWGFETQGVVPDIVVLGKPIGNGFPLGAVVTTPAIAAAFNNGMEFFSTFGGNPVASAAGLAVLDVIAEEKLADNSAAVGALLKRELSALAARHPLVGDVRGLGLFLGVELVRDRATLEPAGAEAGFVVNRLRDAGILAGTEGPHHNVIKIRPPLCFTAADAGFLAGTLDTILGEDGLAPVRR